MTGFVLALALQLAAPASEAVAPEVAERLPDYDCEAEGGYFDKHELEGSERLVHVAGTITPNDLGSARADWLPAAGVLFQPADGKGGVGLQIWRVSRKTLAYGVRSLGPDNPFQLGTLPLDQPIRFSLTLDGSERLEIRVNDQRYNYRDVKVGPANPILMCSGGHFVFDELTALVAEPQA